MQQQQSTAQEVTKSPGSEVARGSEGGLETSNQTHVETLGLECNDPISDVEATLMVLDGPERLRYALQHHDDPAAWRVIEETSAVALFREGGSEAVLEKWWPDGVGVGALVAARLEVLGGVEATVDQSIQRKGRQLEGKGVTHLKVGVGAGAGIQTKDALDRDIATALVHAEASLSMVMEMGCSHPLSEVLRPSNVVDMLSLSPAAAVQPGALWQNADLVKSVRLEANQKAQEQVVVDPSVMERLGLPAENPGISTLLQRGASVTYQDGTLIYGLAGSLSCTMGILADVFPGILNGALPEEALTSKVGVALTVDPLRPGNPAALEITQQDTQRDDQTTASSQSSWSATGDDIFGLLAAVTTNSARRLDIALEQGDLSHTHQLTSAIDPQTLEAPRFLSWINQTMSGVDPNLLFASQAQAQMTGTLALHNTDTKQLMAHPIELPDQVKSAQIPGEMGSAFIRVWRGESIADTWLAPAEGTLASIASNRHLTNPRFKANLESGIGGSLAVHAVEAQAQIMARATQRYFVDEPLEPDLASKLEQTLLWAPEACPV